MSDVAVCSCSCFVIEAMLSPLLVLTSSVGCPVPVGGFDPSWFFLGAVTTGAGVTAAATNPEFLITFLLEGEADEVEDFAVVLPPTFPGSNTLARSKILLRFLTLGGVTGVDDGKAETDDEEAPGVVVSLDVIFEEEEEEAALGGSR